MYTTTKTTPEHHINILVLRKSHFFAATNIYLPRLFTKHNTKFKILLFFQPRTNIISQNLLLNMMLLRML